MSNKRTTVLPQEPSHQALCRIAMEAMCSMERARKIYDTLWFSVHQDNLSKEDALIKAQGRKG